MLLLNPGIVVWIIWLENAFPTSSLIFTRSFPLEMAKQNVLQSIIHTVTVQMTVKVNSEIYITSCSVKAINPLDSQQCHCPRDLRRCSKRSTGSILIHFCSAIFSLWFSSFETSWWQDGCSDRWHKEEGKEQKAYAVVCPLSLEE